MVQNFSWAESSGNPSRQPVYNGCATWHIARVGNYRSACRIQTRSLRSRPECMKFPKLLYDKVLSAPDRPDPIQKPGCIRRRSELRAAEYLIAFRVGRNPAQLDGGKSLVVDALSKKTRSMGLVSARH